MAAEGAEGAEGGGWPHGHPDKAQQPAACNVKRENSGRLLTTPPPIPIDQASFLLEKVHKRKPTAELLPDLWRIKTPAPVQPLSFLTPLKFGAAADGTVGWTLQPRKSPLPRGTAWPA